MKNFLLLLLFTLSTHFVWAQDPCTGNVPIENLANGMDYTIVSEADGVIDITLTVVDNPVGLVGFFGGPGNPISFPDGGGTFTYNLTGQTVGASFVVNMFFNWAAGGQGNSTPITITVGDCAAGATPSSPSLPIDFDDAGVNYDLVSFGGVNAGLVADPTNPSNIVATTTKPAGSECWGGVTLGNVCLTDPIPFATEGMVMTIDVYSPVAGAPILLKVENCGNPGLSSEVRVNTTVANAWETLTFDFANGCGGAPDLNIAYDKISVFPEFICTPDACGLPNPDAGFTFTEAAYYFDNVQMQVLVAPSLPIDFEDAGTNYDLSGFGGASGTIAADPVDPTNTVLSTTKPPGSECWGGVTVGNSCLAETIPFAADAMAITVDVYSPAAGAPILLKVENCDNGALSAEVLVNTTVANAWETLTFNFVTGGCPSIPDFENIDYNKISIFPQFVCGIDACGNPNPAAGFPITADAFYFDNVTMIATTDPIPVAPSIPITFDDANVDYNLAGFGGAGGTIAVDPTDPTNTVLATTKPPGSECWGGVTVGNDGLESVIPFTSGELEMRVDVYSPVAGSTILLKVEDAANPGISAEVSATTSAANTWETLVFDFSNSLTAPINLNNTYDKISVFPQFCGAIPLSTEPHYFDNIRMTTQPYLECRQPTSTVNTEGICGAQDLIVLDPFILDPDEVGGAMLENNAPALYPIGTTDVIYNLTNTSGATSTCTQEVIIEDSELATVGPCDTANGFCSANSCFATIEINPEISDNCGVASVSGTGTFTYEIGLHEHVVTVTDNNGNVTTHIIDVAIHDDFEPEFNNCPTEQVVLADATYPASMMPTASDNCGIDGITNNIPEGGLPAGESTVIFTAEDTYGNTTDCEVSVMVGAGEIISLHPASDIGATLAEDENSQVVTWNPLNATTECSYCEETSLEGFTFVGNYWGHQYFLADETSLTRQDAQLIAEGYDAHLAVISTAGENNYLKEALSNEVRTAWIGLMPQNVNDTWSFVWDNDETNAFDALVLDMNEVNANTRIVLSQDGNWVAATDTEEKYFLIERPCVNFTQVGPYAPGAELGSTQLLRSGDAWPEGNYEVTYAAVDMCGNESQLSFDVTVQPEVSEFCTTAGTDNSVWIEGVTFHEMTSTSASNAGYADFAESVTTMNIGDGVVLLDLTAGGNTTDEVLYWRVWLDRNNDGDFFDAGEVLFEQSTENAHLQTNVALAQEAVTNARLRVAVARHAFPAPCGNPYVGEVEDYTVTLTLPAIIDVERVPQIQVFPNPADTYVNVDVSDFAGEEVTIRVINNLGKSVSFTKEIVTIKGQVRLDLQGITGGMYNISVSTAKRQISKRFVISNVKRMTTVR